MPNIDIKTITGAICNTPDYVRFDDFIINGCIFYKLTNIKNNQSIGIINFDGLLDDRHRITLKHLTEISWTCHHYIDDTYVGVFTGFKKSGEVAQQWPQVGMTATFNDLFVSKLKTVKPTVLKDIKQTTLKKLFPYSKLSDYVGLEGRTPVRANTTYVGVEIELEKVKNLNNIVGSWVVETDGSLKVEGKEFISVPIQFKYLEVELDRLFNSIKADPSPRCSVHVHLNVRDMTLYELRSFILLYLIYERGLYRFSGDRWNNNFCVPARFFGALTKRFVDELSAGHVNQNQKKYSGLNLCPIYGGESSCLGTVEFRHMIGNMDTAWILNWINLIVSLKISAKKMSYEFLLQKLKDMNTDSTYNIFTEDVFGKYGKLLKDMPTFKEDIEGGITFAKTIFAQELDENVQPEQKAVFIGVGQVPEPDEPEEDDHDEPDEEPVQIPF